MEEEQQSTPMERGRPTIFVFIDENSEVQVGAANYEFDIDEMNQILKIARAKLSLVAYQAMRREAQAQVIRQEILRGTGR